MKTKMIVLFMCFALASNVNSFAENALLVKVTLEKRAALLKDGYNTIYVKNKSYELLPSYPGFKTPELSFYYDIILKNEENIEEMISDLKATKYFESIEIYELQYGIPYEEENIEETMSDLKTTKYVESIDTYEQRYSTSSCVPIPPTNDPKIVDGSVDNYALELINARCAWNITKGDPNIIIAIVDTDFELTHEDLKNQIVSIHGNVGSLLTEDQLPHGTRVAGIAAAETNNGKGIAGIAYNSKIAGYRGNNVKAAITAAYNHGHRIINVSLRTTGFDINITADRVALGELTKSAVLVLAAGNTPTATDHWQIANIPGVILVSGVNEHNNANPSTAKHLRVDLCAPSTHVARTDIGNTYGNGPRNGASTSSAAPLVSGTIALMLSVNPNLTPARIEEILKETAAPINDAHRYPAGVLGAGSLDAYAAVQAACAEASVDFTNQTVTTNQDITGCNIHVQNVTVGNNNNNNAHLQLDAKGKVTINGPFKVHPGASLKINK